MTAAGHASPTSPGRNRWFTVTRFDQDDPTARRKPSRNRDDPSLDVDGEDLYLPACCEHLIYILLFYSRMAFVEIDNAV